MAAYEVVVDPTGEYQYIGTNFDLEPGCVEECIELAEQSSQDEISKIMGASQKLMPLMFPRIDEGRFYTSEFDGLLAIMYELTLTKDSRLIRFIWIKL